MEQWWWALILFGSGLLLLAIDLVVPSGGALVVLSALAFVASVAMGFVENAWFGLGVLIGEAVVLSLLAAAFIKWWPHTPLGRRILIQRHRVEPTTVDVTDDVGGDLVGQVGVAKSKLLPAGSVVISGKRYDAVSDGMPIESGTVVEVLAVEMNRITVRPSDRPVTEIAERSDPLARPIEELGLDALEDPLS